MYSELDLKSKTNPEKKNRKNPWNDNNVKSSNKVPKFWYHKYLYKTLRLRPPIIEFNDFDKWDINFPGQIFWHYQNWLLTFIGLILLFKKTKICLTENLLDLLQIRISVLTIFIPFQLHSWCSRLFDQALHWSVALRHWLFQWTPWQETLCSWPLSADDPFAQFARYWRVRAKNIPQSDHAIWRSQASLRSGQRRRR